MELYAHNKETFDKAIAIYQEYRRCAVIQATGTGKTYVTMQLLDTLFHGKQVLYVVPVLAVAQVIQSYKDWDYPNVKFVTYAGLKNYEPAEEILILDELHRAGAKSWMRYVLRIIDKFEYVLGLTATPFRYLDGKRDMGQELFGDNVVYGPDIKQAVDRGIIPGFDYVVIPADLKALGEELEKSTKDINIVNKIAKLVSTYDLTEQVKAQILPSHKKSIVFYPDVDVLMFADDTLKEWFGEDVHIYELHSRITKKEREKNLRDFSTDECRSVLKVVDMANEGLHVDGVNLLIFLRHTESGNVFIQQVGRAISASAKSKSKIIDICSNYENLKILTQESQQSSVNLTPVENIKKDDKLNLIAALMYVTGETRLEWEKLFEKVYVTWSDWEDEILKKYYEREGGDVCLRIPGKARGDCIKRAGELKLGRIKRWTEQEDDILKRFYNTERLEIRDRLPGRTDSSIQARASKLGVIPKWYPEEELRLIRGWDQYGLAICSRLERHSLQDILEKAKKLGIYNGKV